jgi:hypothetical protein
MVEPLSLTRKELVIIPSLDGAGVDAKQPLWNGITAHEYFPPIKGSALYVLTLQMPVDSVIDIPQRVKELDKAMELLALAWPFSGGSFLPVEQRVYTNPQSGDSNAAAVRAQILARDGFRDVSVSHRFPIETMATYSRPPLTAAATIARAMHARPALAELLGYHQTAWMECYFHNRGKASSWFAHLYNVRDFLQKYFKGEDKARSALGLPSSSWQAIGKKLNNGYRHATATGIAPELSRAEIAELFQASRKFVIAYLEYEHLL